MVALKQRQLLELQSMEFVQIMFNNPVRACIFVTTAVRLQAFIHSFSSLSCDRSKVSSKASSSYSAIQSFLLQMRVFSSLLKVIQ
jgi:hypothetical protein